jgi:hypothetical protein
VVTYNNAKEPVCGGNDIQNAHGQFIKPMTWNFDGLIGEFEVSRASI